MIDNRQSIERKARIDCFLTQSLITQKWQLTSKSENWFLMSTKVENRKNLLNAISRRWSLISDGHRDNQRTEVSEIVMSRRKSENIQWHMTLRNSLVSFSYSIHASPALAPLWFQISDMSHARIKIVLKLRFGRSGLIADNHTGQAWEPNALLGLQFKISWLFIQLARRELGHKVAS